MLFRISSRSFCLACTLVLLLLPASAYAQSKVEYDIAFPNAVHHEAEVAVTFSGVPGGKPLEVHISRSSPGRYAVQEFAKNVYNVRATDEKGAPLSITRPNGFQWNITGIKARGGRVHVTYTLFADLGSGTFSGIDNTMAHLSMPATFMWARGMEHRNSTSMTSTRSLKQKVIAVSPMSRDARLRKLGVDSYDR